MKRDVYISSEDSALLRSALRGRAGGRCLEIGAGNTGGLVELSGRFEHAVGSDILKPEMGDWRDAGADFVLADRAGCFRDKIFDLVFFNPPYVPSDTIEDSAVDAGKEDDVPLAFLRDALRVVKDSGKVLMLVYGEKPSYELEGECERKGFQLAKVGETHVFYEDLSVYEAATGLRSQY